MPDLIDQTSVPPSSDYDTGANVLGNEFSVSADDQLATHLSYYWNAGSANPMNYLELFDAVSGALLAYVATGIFTTAGWYTSALPNPVALVNGRQYLVACFGNNAPNRYSYWSSPQASESPLVYSASRRNTSGTPVLGTYPNGVTTRVPAVSVTVSGPTSPPPATTGDVETSLSSWLISTGDNTHQADGLPWITHTLLALLTGSDGSQVGDFSLLQVFPAEYQSLYGALRELFELVGGVAGVIALVNGIRNLTPGLTLTDAFNSLSSQVDANAGTLGTLLARSNPFDGATWTLSAEVDFDTALAWNVAADAYVISFTAVPDFRPATFVAGINWLPRLAWWAPWNGLQVGERHFIDFDAAIVADGSNLIPGILLYAEGGGAGHIQAWLRP